MSSQENSVDLSTGAIIVLSNLPDQASAEKLARYLLEKRLAACVNILSPCVSIYHWQGKIENASEIPLLIKTSADRYTALEQAIQALHPYELPEIIYVSLDGGSKAYFQWIASATTDTLV